MGGTLKVGYEAAMAGGTACVSADLAACQQNQNADSQ
jgi:hypothetical protein